MSSSLHSLKFILKKSCDKILREINRPILWDYFQNRSHTKLLFFISFIGPSRQFKDKIKFHSTLF